MAPAAPDSLIDEVARGARESGVFGAVRVEPGLVVCAASGSAAPAAYRLAADGSGLAISLVMADRWLSESIEADLMHTGDSIEELIEEELADQGAAIGRLACQHYRSDDRLFTFRSVLPVRAGEAGAAATALRCLLAYEAAFRRLGDMGADGAES